MRLALSGTACPLAPPRLRFGRRRPVPRHKHPPAWCRRPWVSTLEVPAEPVSPPAMPPTNAVPSETGTPPSGGQAATIEGPTELAPAQASTSPATPERNPEWVSQADAQRKLKKILKTAPSLNTITEAAKKNKFRSQASEIPRVQREVDWPGFEKWAIEWSKNKAKCQKE